MDGGGGDGVERVGVVEERGAGREEALGWEATVSFPFSSGAPLLLASLPFVSLRIPDSSNGSSHRCATHTTCLS